MLKTERLYYTDCYLKEFEAGVIEVEPAGQRFRVVLDRTAFYPDSGGQPPDRGTLAGMPVTEVLDEGDAVVHLLEGRPQGGRVAGQIDWERRFDHMQQHTGQHILSAAFEKSAGAKTVSFHLGAEISTIDLDSDRLGRRQIEEAEDLANRVIFENRDVRILFRASSEAQQMDLRKPTERQGDVRLIEVADFDLSACGGTHVRTTGAIGMVLVRKFERLKGNTRLEFLCGMRALRAARRDFSLLGEAARLFSGALENVPTLVAKQSEELKTAQRANQKLVESLAEYRALELWTNAGGAGDRRIVKHIFEAEENAQAKRVAHAIARRPSSVALIGVKGEPAALFFAQSSGGPDDMGAILKQTVAKLGGKGGGARDFAQGGGLDEVKLDDALAVAERLLSG
jgi:alanyl-tRNA synthetase